VRLKCPKCRRQLLPTMLHESQSTVTTHCNDPGGLLCRVYAAGYAAGVDEIAGPTTGEVEFQIGVNVIKWNPPDRGAKEP